jgi:hypothetical protein
LRANSRAPHFVTLRGVSTESAAGRARSGETPLPTRIVARGRAIGEPQERRVPVLALHLGEEAAEEPRRQLGVEGQFAVRKRVSELGRVVAARGSAGLRL